MFGKKEAQELKTRFWTSFGVYMRKHNDQFDSKIRWVNYRTGIKDIYFRLEADNKVAQVSIEIQHADPTLRAIFFEQFQEFKVIIESNTANSFIWNENAYNQSGLPIAKIFVSLQGKSIFLTNNWPELFSFFEQNILGLVEFWEDCKDVFLDLNE